MSRPGSGPGGLGHEKGRLLWSSGGGVSGYNGKKINMERDIEKELLRLAGHADRFLNCVDISINLKCSADYIERVCCALVERGWLMERKGIALFEYRITEQGRSEI